jgi:protein-S-isoprenylcysteine O-methyltransferase Ste14
MKKSLSTLRSWNVVAGNFFFRYRNALFPLIFLCGAVTLRPSIIMGSLVLDRFLIYTGVGIAILGQAVRLVTIGLEYIHRGGKDGQVYAGRLVQGGVYAITRNPMYVGNALIAIGMTMLFGSPLGYLLLIPLFLFVYQAIIAAEEAYLSNKFGSEYDDYCSAVNRFVPSMARIPQVFSETRFDWRHSLRRDIGTVVGLTIGLIFVPVWRAYFLYGWDATKAVAIRAFILSTVIGGAYFFLVRLKKNKRLFQNSPRRQKL